MIFADTGYLVAILAPRDELHLRATAWSAVLREPLLTTEYVLVETVNHLTTRLDRAVLAQAFESLLKMAGVQIAWASRALFTEELASHRRRGDQSWSLTDCISFNVMKAAGVTRALAYDHHFEQAGFEALLRRDPP